MFFICVTKINIIGTIPCFYEHVFYFFYLYLLEERELKHDMLASSTVHPMKSCPSLWYRFMNGTVDSP